MFGSFSHCQARYPSEILPNTQNSVDRKEDKDDERLQGARVQLMKDKQVLNLPMHCTNAFAVFFFYFYFYISLHGGGVTARLKI